MSETHTGSGWATREVRDFLHTWQDGSETLTVQTSGSTGVPKRMAVEKSRMSASARMTCDFLGLQRGQTALLCMSLDYIAGQMMVVRALERELHLMATPPDGHPLRGIATDIDLAAMVPMQVWNSLQDEAERQSLCRIRHLLVGGGAISPQLESLLRPLPHAVWSTYGMTETLSHIALRRVSGPEASPWYTPLPGIRLSQEADTRALVIHAPALCPAPLHTHDIVEFADADAPSTQPLPDRQFRILGRTDNTVCSGGVKIQLEEVETLLHSHLNQPLQLTSCPDPKFGEALVLLVTQPLPEGILRHLLRRHPYWVPRHTLLVPSLPTTPTGKPDRAAARCLASGLTTR